MTSAASLSKYLDDYNFTPVPSADCLTLDTEAQSAEATAHQIRSHFGLGDGSCDVIQSHASSHL
jgi:hypothetical protein